MLLFIVYAKKEIKRRKLVSIHLMLLFIGISRCSHRARISVSIHLMLLFIGTACQIALGRNGFNTSHVTLYLMPLSFQIKYLKCFNTSHVTLYQCGYVLATTVHGFQYISCYSLSKERKTRLTIPVSFNTSHVTLYPGGIQRSDYGLIVSIHLMLLFIESGYEKGYEKG